MSKGPHTSPKTVASPERSTDYVEEQALHLSVEEVRRVSCTKAVVSVLLRFFCLSVCSCPLPCSNSTKFCLLSFTRLRL